MRILIFAILLALSVGVWGVTWDSSAILDKHNYERRAWGLTSVYSWDANLAAGAQAYAQRCTWGHSPNDYRGRDYASRKGVGFGGSYQECVGENLSANAGGTSIDDNGWHNERQWWTCSTNGCTSGKVCGHYTQVLWRNSARLGCGATTCTTGSPFSNFPTWNFLVCWYNPCGNYNGEHPLGGGHMCSYNPPVDCIVSEWSTWSACSTTCGGGSRSRSRSVTQSPSSGGASCPLLTESQSCNTHGCPVDCTWNEWGAWTACSAECTPGGTRTRSRTQNAPVNGGAACVGERSQSEACNGATPCPIDCTWNNWGSWSDCTASCEPGGTQTRSRTQNAPQYNGDPCSGSSTQSQSCNAAVPCPVDCTWNAWTAWSACDAQCGGGSMTRSRTNSPAQTEGSACTGPTVEAEDCNSDPCPINCTWNAWGAWTPCSLACGGGETNRTRTKNAAQYGGVDCTGQASQTEQCNTHECPIDCVWNPWSLYSNCSAECGGGTKTRTRTFIAAQAGGSTCTGLSSQSTACNEQPCPVDCEVGEWSQWTTCTASCDGGTQERTRVVTQGAQNEGAVCPMLHESVPCNTHECEVGLPPVDCVLSEWTTWSGCTLDCGGGTRGRSRDVTMPRSSGGADCPIPLSVSEPCNTNACSPTAVPEQPEGSTPSEDSDHANTDTHKAADEDEELGITSNVGGLPMWAWIVIAIGGLLALAGIITGIVFAVKKVGGNSSPFSKKYYEMY